MSYLFGIIDFSGTKIMEDELNKLDLAVKGADFVSHTELSEKYAIGYSHNPGRIPNCAIYKHKHLVLLADLRIYNTDLLKTYFEFGNQCEAFAKAFLKWGVQCPKYINGDFAVVVIDLQTNEAHLIRDHIGARPLVYYQKDGRLIFSSHEYGIAKMGLFRPKLSEDKLLRRLFRFKSKYSQTAFEHILKHTPGHVLTFTQSGILDSVFWKPEKIATNYRISFEEAASQLRQLIIRATVARIETGKTGVHVSGGLDSTGIACILADCIADRNRLIGYSWTPEELNDAGDDQNEKEFIDNFSTDKGVKVRYLTVSSSEFIKDMVDPEFEIMQIECPTMRMAGEDQVTSLFSGWGGDEFLSLSLRGVFNHFFFNLKFRWLYKFVRKYGIRSTIYFAKNEVLPLFVPFGLLPTYRPTDWIILKLLKTSFILKHWKLIFFHHNEHVFGYGSRKKLIIKQLKLYHLPARMDSWAYHSEKFGFEYKYPLLDKDVLEYWFSLPVNFTFEKLITRGLYREIMRGILPEPIRTREDKSETLRVKYLVQNMTNGKEYLEKLFEAIPDQDHLPFFKTKAYRKLFESSIPKKRRKKWFFMERLYIYIRNVELAKKYIGK